MSKFADYLRSIGTSEEDVKLLDTPAANAAYEKMSADADARLAAEKKKLDDYQVNVEKYYIDTNARAEQLRNDAIAARANEARARAAILEMQKQGLIDNAKQFGFDPEAAPAAPAAAAPKYLTADEIMPALDAAGDGLAAVMDAAAEHARLFPDKPFNARELRRASVAAKKSFYDYWQETFKVADAREAAAKARQEAHDKAVADAARADERAKLASEYANPNTRPASPSSAPFIIKRASDGKPETPWSRSENELSDLRVRKATENIIKRGEVVTH